MTDKIIFHLAKHFPPLTPIRPYLHCAESLYDQIKHGKKTREWRNANLYWVLRLFNRSVFNRRSNDLSKYLKVHKAWFVEGYPRANLPRLEADIIKVIYHPVVKEFPSLDAQLEIKIANVKEIRK